MCLKTAVFLDTKSGVTTLTLEVPGVSNFHAGIGEMEWILRVGKAVEVGAKQIQQKTIFWRRKLSEIGSQIVIIVIGEKIWAFLA